MIYYNCMPYGYQQERVQDEKLTWRWLATCILVSPGTFIVSTISLGKHPIINIEKKYIVL